MHVLYLYRLMHPQGTTQPIVPLLSVNGSQYFVLFAHNTGKQRNKGDWRLLVRNTLIFKREYVYLNTNSTMKIWHERDIHLGRVAQWDRASHSKSQGSRPDSNPTDALAGPWDPNMLQGSQFFSGWTRNSAVISIRWVRPPPH